MVAQNQSTTADDKASQTPPSAAAPNIAEKVDEAVADVAAHGTPEAPPAPPAPAPAPPVAEPPAPAPTPLRTVKEQLAKAGGDYNPPPALMMPPPDLTPLTKQDLKALLEALDFSIDETVKFRNAVAKLLGVEGRAGPVSPVALAPELPPGPISTESMPERGEYHRQAVREEIKRGKLPVAKNILETYGPRWTWQPSEESINSAIRQVNKEQRQAAAPAPAGAPPATPATVSGPKPKTAQDAILMALTGGGFMAYKPLVAKVLALGFTAEQFSDAYSNLTAMNLVVEESLDKIRKA